MRCVWWWWRGIVNQEGESSSLTLLAHCYTTHFLTFCALPACYYHTQHLYYAPHYYLFPVFLPFYSPPPLPACACALLPVCLHSETPPAPLHAILTTHSTHTVPFVFMPGLLRTPHTTRLHPSHTLPPHLNLQDLHSLLLCDFVYLYSISPVSTCCCALYISLYYYSSFYLFALFAFYILLTLLLSPSNKTIPILQPSMHLFSPALPSPHISLPQTKSRKADMVSGNEKTEEGRKRK